MALALGAAQVPSLGNWLSPELSPRVNQAYPKLNTRNNSTTGNNTVNMFIDAKSSNFQYAASIVAACADQTVYALQCTGPASVESETCGPNAIIFTITSGSTFYEFSTATATQTLGNEVTLTEKETCALAGTTAAACSATVSATVSNTKTATSAFETLSGSDYYRFDVEITGGAEKTANATATCRSAATAVNTNNVLIWGLAAAFSVASLQMVLW